MHELTTAVRNSRLYRDGLRGIYRRRAGERTGVTATPSTCLVTGAEHRHVRFRKERAKSGPTIER